MGNVDTYQKALETILRKAAESSRADVEKVYNQLERKVLDEQHAVDTVHDTLKDTDGKLQTSEANRAQRFVCYKIAKGNLKLADKIKHDLSQLHTTDAELEFIPDKSLMDFIKGLQGIGRVQSDVPRCGLYNVKGCSDINIKLPDDVRLCRSVGSCLINDSQLLVSDFNNSKLKLMDLTTMSVVNLCTLDLKPICICCVSPNEVAVTCENNTVQIASIQQKKFTVTRKFETSHWCFGIAYHDNKLYVTDARQSLYIYNMKGTLLNTIMKDTTGNNLFSSSKHITFNEQRTRFFVADRRKGIVCFDVAGRYMSTIGGTDYEVVGVCVDKGGNVIAVGSEQNGTILQYNSEDGRKVGVIMEGLPNPLSVCFHPRTNKLFVTLGDSNVAKMYELE